MSNNKTAKKNNALVNSALNSSDLNSLAKVKWNSMQTDLRSALGTWSDLDHTAVAKSSEEEQLDKVKTLIENLKLKLNDF